jgi:hypothetical protein
MKNTTKVTIGDFERTYFAIKTDAPLQYDGFGTIQIYSGPQDGKTIRYVLVDVDHKTWQESRYGSGLYFFEDVTGIDDHIRETLYKKLNAPAAEEA